MATYCENPSSLKPEIHCLHKLIQMYTIAKRLYFEYVKV